MSKQIIGQALYALSVTLFYLSGVSLGLALAGLFPWLVGR
jgi:hypothetical protein